MQCFTIRSLVVVVIVAVVFVIIAVADFLVVVVIVVALVCEIFSMLFSDSLFSLLCPLPPFCLTHTHTHSHMHMLHTSITQ